MKSWNMKKVFRFSWLALGLCGLCCAPLLISGLAAFFATGAMLTGEALGFVMAAMALGVATVVWWMRQRRRVGQGPTCEI